MTIAALIAWSLSGGLLAAAWPEPGQPRAAWVPVALFLGPLWLAVASDQHKHESPFARDLS